MRIICLALSLIAMFPAIATSQNVKITGLGATKCDKYIIDINGNETSEKIYFAWAQGFMNGALVRAPAGVDENLDLLPLTFLVNEQMAFLKKWCTTYHANDFSDASFALYKELRTHMKK